MCLSTLLLLPSNIQINIYQMTAVYCQQIFAPVNLIHLQFPQIELTPFSVVIICFINQNDFSFHRTCQTLPILEKPSQCLCCLWSRFHLFSPLKPMIYFFYPCHSFLFTPTLKILTRTDTMEVTHGTQKEASRLTLPLQRIFSCL